MCSPVETISLKEKKIFSVDFVVKLKLILGSWNSVEESENAKFHALYSLTPSIDFILKKKYENFF